MALPVNDVVEPGGPSGGGSGGGGTGNAYGNVGTVVFDLNVVKQEAGSLLRILAYASLYSDDDLDFVAYVSIDGVVQQACPVRMPFDNSNSRGRVPVTIPLFQPGLAAGAHRVVFSIANLVTNSALYVRPGATIEITELKKAAQ